MKERKKTRKKEDKKERKKESRQKGKKKRKKEGKNQRQKGRKKYSNNSHIREHLRTHKAHIRPFDNQTSASCKILHMSVKTIDRKKGRNTVIIHYVNVSVLIKLIYVHLIIKLQLHTRYCTCLLYCKNQRKNERKKENKKERRQKRKKERRQKGKKKERKKVKNRDKKEGRNTLRSLIYVNISVLIKLIYGHSIIKHQPRARYCTCL